MNAKQSIMMTMGVVAVCMPLQAQEAKNATNVVKKKPAVVRITDSSKSAGKAPAAATLRISDFGQWKVRPISKSTPKSTSGKVRISDANVARDVPKIFNKRSAWEPIEEAAPPIPGAPLVDTTPEAPETIEVPGPPTVKIVDAAPALPVQPVQTPVAGVQPLEIPMVEEAPVIDSPTPEFDLEADPFPVVIEESAPMIIEEQPVIAVEEAAVEVVEEKLEEIVEEVPVEIVEEEPTPMFDNIAETLVGADDAAKKATEAILDDAFKSVEALESAEEEIETEGYGDEALPLIIAAQPDDPAIDGDKVMAAQDVDPADLFGAVTEVRVEAKKSEAKVPEDLAGEMLTRYEPIYVMNDGWTEYTDRSIYWISHRPLYFEDPNLERCGLNKNGIFEPIVSAALFYSNAALLPMHMGVHPPCQTVRSKGDCPSCHQYGEECYLVSRDLRKLLRTKEGLRGAALQTLAVTGLVFLIP